MDPFCLNDKGKRLVQPFAHEPYFKVAACLRLNRKIDMNTIFFQRHEGGNPHVRQCLFPKTPFQLNFALQHARNKIREGMREVT